VGASRLHLAGLDFAEPVLREWRDHVDAVVLDADPEQVWGSSFGNARKWRARLHTLLHTDYPEACKLRELREECHADETTSVALAQRGAAAFALGAKFETGHRVSVAAGPAGAGAQCGEAASGPVTRDMQLAFSHYVEALFCGYSPAMVKVAEYYIEGYNTVKIDFFFAKMLLYEAWRRLERSAGSWLARVLSSSNHLCHESPVAKTAARAWLKAALWRGCPIAICLSAWNYQDVLGTDKTAPLGKRLRTAKEPDYLRALAWLKKGAAFYPDCAFLKTFHDHYASEAPVKHDELVAMMHDSLGFGHAEAQYLMCRREQSSGCRLFPDDDALLARKLATEKKSHQLDRLVFLESTTTKPRAPEREISLLFLKQAALQHFPDAMADLSTCRLTDCTSTLWSTDAKEGLAWAEQAAEHNAPTAFWNLALCYRYGWGCPTSLSLSLCYLSLAKNAGHLRADALLPVWTDVLTPTPAAAFAL